ncbi:glycosyltransferase family A protein [Enterococcus ratti]|uniref:glycosyltransferase family 2 protein n=1 Tax=Enterococcus ratti TaxID=150033 RepID=UPI0035152642
MEKVSVIVPIYNGHSYLETTIQALLDQPYENIELILIDDGSQDDSYQICQRFLERDDRIVLIHKSNAGICAARNTGLAYATGEFVSFIDQDDTIDSNIYVHLVKQIGQADMIVGSKKMQLIDQKQAVRSEVNYVYEKKLLSNQKDIADALFNLDHQMTFFHLWNCLYRRKIIEDYQLKFDEKFRYGQEDTLFNFNYVSKCQTIQLVPEIVYVYSQRELTSTSLKNNPLVIEDFKWFIDTLNHLEFSKEVYFYYKKYGYTYFLRYGLSIYSQFARKKNKQKEVLQQINWLLSQTSTNEPVIVETSIFYRQYLKLANQLMKKQRYRTLSYLIQGTTMMKKIVSRVSS